MNVEGLQRKGAMLVKYRMTVAWKPMAAWHPYQTVIDYLESAADEHDQRVE